MQKAESGDRAACMLQTSTHTVEAVDEPIQQHCGPANARLKYKRCCGNGWLHGEQRAMTAYLVFLMVLFGASRHGQQAKHL